MKAHTHCIDDNKLYLYNVAEGFTKPKIYKEFQKDQCGFNSSH